MTKLRRSTLLVHDASVRVRRCPHGFCLVVRGNGMARPLAGVFVSAKRLSSLKKQVVNLCKPKS